MDKKLEITYEITNEIKNDIINLVKCVFLKSSIILLLVQIAVFFGFSFISLLLYITTIFFTLTFIFIERIYNKQFIEEKKTIIFEDNISVKTKNNEIKINYDDIKNIYTLNNIYCIATNKESVYIPIKDDEEKDKIEKLLIEKTNIRKIKIFKKFNILFLYLNEILLVILIILKFVLFINEF